MAQFRQPPRQQAEPLKSQRDCLHYYARCINKRTKTRQNLIISNNRFDLFAETGSEPGNRSLAKNFRRNSARRLTPFHLVSGLRAAPPVLFPLSLRKPGFLKAVLPPSEFSPVRSTCAPTDPREGSVLQQKQKIPDAIVGIAHSAPLTYRHDDVVTAWSHDEEY